MPNVCSASLRVVRLPDKKPKDPGSHFEILFNKGISTKVYLFEIKSWMDDSWRLAVELKESNAQKEISSR